ncbi:ShlB/FhaC/HecB family hemolysin secretion/activation protein [Paraburkholderia ferrariae]|uniref:ShlB/FhaC/HecB family hemolysin secretion/activation protein n=1 Tax=Paraburkholderia ferrariae TaxID=386056 RepID=A0ABU9RM73_9BURK
MRDCFKIDGSIISRVAKFAVHGSTGRSAITRKEALTRSAKSMRNACPICIFALLCVAPLGKIAAAPSPDEARTSREQMQDMQALWQVQQHESRQKSLQQSVPASESPTVGTGHGAACLPWDTVEVRGLDLLSARQKRTLFDALHTDCVTAEKLGALTRLIAAMFLEQGYFRINLDQGHVGRALIWTVRTAKVAAIRNDTSMNTASLFPGLIGKPVNVHDLDQGLEQANRLPGHRVTMDVYPDQNGDVILALSDVTTGAVHGSMGWNSLGSGRTGRAQVDAEISLSNLVGLADSLTINVTSTLHTEPSYYNRSAGALYTVPYGRWTFSALGGASAYRTSTALAIHTVRLDGGSWFAGLRGEYVLSRDGAHINSAYGQLTREVVESRFMGTAVALQGASLSTVAIGLNHTALFDGNALGANFEYKQGLPWLGADKDVPGSGLPVSQFRKLATSLSWSHAYRISSLVVRFDHELAAQYSADNLPPIEQIGITDRGTVRGFRDTYLTGDYGFYLHQTATSPLHVASVALSPYIGLDAGRARQRGGEWQGAISGTIGVTLDRKPWSANIALSQGRAFAQFSGDACETEFMTQVHASF